MGAEVRLAPAVFVHACFFSLLYIPCSVQFVFSFRERLHQYRNCLLLLSVELESRTLQYKEPKKTDADTHTDTETETRGDRETEADTHAHLRTYQRRKKYTHKDRITNTCCTDERQQTVHTHTRSPTTALENNTTTHHTTRQNERAAPVLNNPTASVKSRRQFGTVVPGNFTAHRLFVPHVALLAALPLKGSPALRLCTSTNWPTVE